MNPYEFEVRLTPAAREMLQLGEALVIDWHRLAVCCAGAGESSLYVMKEEGARKRRGLVRLKGEDPVYAARAIFPHLAGREIKLDARKVLGFRRFTSDLPGDFGLRSVLGRLPGS
ncbi:MAG: Cysteine synthase [uncultured Rubrobacteraceae bacterium]|uniref:Cysteine synthase n=1 Tax=uncultured Rubrobacteraceae bacterium TaxID=349277 RepID=A0A6J4R3N4_9ACTN|nr:MAG: Cysteine synthase [uncultured Rubrobacteraceae bacterium]